MNQNQTNKIFGILLLVMLSFSCSSDLDFDQVNDLKLEPVFIANLTSFEIPASQFVVNGVEQNVAFDAQDFDIFRDSFFRNRLTRADFFFEINNTITRSYSLDIQLLDGNDQLLYTIHFDVPAYSGTEKLITQTEIFENANLDLLKSSKRMGFVIKMGAGSALNANSPGSLKLRSSATAYLVVE
ncbi:hypothetical protein QO200_02885 [Flavobacterium sp. Arc3]|jgi:hypothetical protein|uniref:hypothetical protein n=1 Tax=unclassified Flavobacterium TaxID=196869 RepID=UPI00352DB18A